MDVLQNNNSSPCYQCEFKDDDKNNDRCANCKKRIEYAKQENMYNIFPSREIIEGGESIQELDIQHKVALQEIKEMQQSLSKRKRRRPALTVIEKVPVKSEEKIVRRRGRKPKSTYKLLKRAQVFLKFSPEYINIFHDLVDIAQAEHRTISMQAMYFVKEGVEEVKKSNKI